jgi:hypothetical protein
MVLNLKSMGNMKVKMLPVVVLCIFMGLSACTRNYVGRDIVSSSDVSSFDIWLNDTLIPYLVQQLGRHPRFKGQPILLVRMQGDKVQPRIDDLTDQIRQKIMDALLKQPGLDLSWRPEIHPWRHHRSLEEVSCGEFRKIHYYVGIDCGLTRVKRHLYVKIRALNLVEQKWVSGFGKSWQGTPTAAQRAALDHEHPDDYLRGLRPLPFSDRQPDLLAAYLARNLSCLIRQGAEDDPVVYVENVALDTPKVFQTTLELAAKYLARFREVEVTDDRTQANITVVSEIHAIHQNLRQVWLAARHRQGEKYLPGAETEAYVLMDAQKQTAVADTHPRKPSKPKRPLQQARAPALISSFDLLTPLNPAFCLTDTPWIAGMRQVESREHLPSGGCLAFEIRLSKAAHIFIVGQGADGELTALFPSDCPAFKKIDIHLRPGKVLRFPPLSNPGQGSLALDDSPGMEKVYAIAITEQDLANRFAYRLANHQGLCRPAKNFEGLVPVASPINSDGRIQHWQKYLNHLSGRYPDMVQWREILFWHDPP